ncbi:MAG: signal peptidase II [Holosporales bacterium]|jgi:signal peptidase II|nr:signal peptidase II [Holosporales bacterium]
MKNKQISIFCILLFFFIVVFDQATKWSILAFLPPGQVIDIFPSFLNLVLVMNSGTSFGLLAPHTMTEFYLIIAATVLCISFLFYLFFKLRATIEKVLCVFISGGAVGNLIDRFCHGAVIDFIDLHYRGCHWPAFNIADSFISIGAISLVVYNLFCTKE